MIEEGHIMSRREFEEVSKDDAEQAIAEAARGRLAAHDPTLVSADIAALTPYKAGAPWRLVAKELGVPEDELLMLAANENVLGPSPKAMEAIAKAASEANLYPDGGAQLLRAALARKLAVTPDHIAVGNGSNEIIELLVRTFVQPGQTVVTAWPSFVVYRLITQAHGREILIAPLRDDRYDLSALAALVDRRTKLVFIANPNNPTGTFVPKRAISAFLDRIPRQVIVVLDEAYFEYASSPDYPNGILDFDLLAPRPNHPRLVVLRTFSKIYGLAGLRIGYGVMDPMLAQFIDRVRQPYNVSSVAQAAALAALEDEAHLKASQELVREGRIELEKGLSGLGFKVVPSQANFVLFRLESSAAAVVEKLRARGILVRDMRGYDMPNTIRVTVGTRAMNKRVLGALADIVMGRT
jgi:histidinol-phosphate aminotransferase